MGAGDRMSVAKCIQDPHRHVAKCNALLTNRAILPPEGGETAFEIMLPLQEAVEATTDVLQIRRTVL